MTAAVLDRGSADAQARRAGGGTAVTRPPHTVTPAWFRSHVRPANHAFDHPVLVGRDHWWSRRPRVQDGVHRSLAAMELGLPVLIRYGYPEDDDYDHSDVYRVTSASASRDELIEPVLSLASFRCSAGPWIRADAASASAQRLALYLPRFPSSSGGTALAPVSGTPSRTSWCSLTVMWLPDELRVPTMVRPGCQGNRHAGAGTARPAAYLRVPSHCRRGQRSGRSEASRPRNGHDDA